MYLLVWAEDTTGAIGKDGKLPWHLPNDLKFFRTTTTGKTIVMGRKTFESMVTVPCRTATTIFYRVKKSIKHRAQLLSVNYRSSRTAIFM